LTCDLFDDRDRDFFGLRKATQDSCREAINLPEFCSGILRPTDCWNDSFCLIAIGTFSADCDTQTVMSKRRIGESFFECIEGTVFLVSIHGQMEFRN
jgi:hypothetical protein